jgi:hypothetical protein
MAGQYRFKDINGNIVAQISASVEGAIAFSGSVVDFTQANNVILGNVQLAGTASNALLLDGFDSQAFAFTSSIHPFTASTNTRLDSIETISASNISRLNSLEEKTGSLATTGSNIFYGQQTFSGSLYVQDNLIVQGSSSLQNITASAVSIGTNIVYLNTDTPAVRYAGLTVQDSGSSAGVTGSILWDSLCNKWIYSNPSTVGYSGGMLLSGPRTTTLGTESPLTCNYIAKSGGGDHLYDSCITDSGTLVTINSATQINSSITGCGAISTSGTGLNASIRINNTTSSTGKDWHSYSLNNGNFGLYNNTDGNYAYQISCTGIATFTNTICATGIVSSTWVGAQGLRFGSAPSIQGVYLGNSGTTTGDYATIEMVGGVCGGSEIDFTYPSADFIGRIGYNNMCNHMWFVTNSCERIRITSSGNIGIGCTAPDLRLVLVAPSSNTSIMAIRSTTGNNIFNFISNGTQGFGILDIGRCTESGTFGPGHIRLRTDGPSWVQGGNLGVGTSNPLQPLHIDQGAIASVNLGVPAASGTTQRGILRLTPGQGTYGETLDIGMNVGPTYAWLQSTNTADLAVCYPLALNPNGGNVFIASKSDNSSGAYLQIGGSNVNKISLTGGSSQNGMRWESVAGANTYYLFNGNFGTCGWGLYNVTTAASPLWITNGGCVGINTTSPNARLEVQKTGASTSAIFINQCSNDEATIRFKSTHSASSDYRVGASILFESAWEVYNQNINRSIISVSPCGAVHLGNTQTSNAGDAYVLSTDPVHKIGMVGNGTAYARLMMQERAGCWISLNNGSGVNYGIIQRDGGSGVTYGSNSDYRLKTNIQNMISSCGLARVMCLRPVLFDWITECRSGEGFIAHELQEIIPNAVSGEKDGINEHCHPSYQNVDTRNIVPTLVKAMQEQQCMIDTLKSCLGIS